MNEIIDRFVGIDTLRVNAAVVDAEGTIVGVNEAWKEFGRRGGLSTPEHGVGCRYLHFCNGNDERLRLLRDELADLLAGKLDLLTHVYPCHSPEARRWFLMLGVPLSRARTEGAALLHLDVSALLPLRDDESPKLREAPASMLASITSVIQRSVRESVLAMRETGAAPRLDTPRDAVQDRVDALSPRQRDVFALLGEGKTNLEIARALTVSPNTVKLHVSAILRRLELDSRTQAALIAARLPGLPRTS